jgi:hypothetical protein
MSSPNLPTDTAFPPTGAPPFYPPPGLLFQYRHPAPNGSQYHAASLGMNLPQLYYGAPPHPPFGQHGNAGGPWGYGHYPPSPFPGPFLQHGDPQPTYNAPDRMSQTQVRAEVGQSQLHTNVGQLQHAEAGRSHVCTEVGQSQVTAEVVQSDVRVGPVQATNKPVQTVTQPLRNTPNKQVSEGGMSHSI